MFNFERERQSVSGEGAERERETQNPKQAPGSELSAQNPRRVSNSEWGGPDLSQSQKFNRLSRPGASTCKQFLNNFVTVSFLQVDL